MPNYAWVCFACQGSSDAGTDVCQHCGFSARATARDIELAQVSRSNHVLPNPAHPVSKAVAPSPRPTAPAPLVALLLVAFGVLCLVGAYQSFSDGRWPAFMPPQLDLLAVPLGWLSEKLGAWVGGAIAAVIGVFCVLGGILGAKDRGAA